MIVQEKNIDFEKLKNDSWKKKDELFIYPKKNEKVAFLIKIWKKESRVIVNYSFNPELAKSVDEMILFLRQYKSFLDRSIKIADKRLFGDIIRGKDFKPENTNEIDNSIKYWENAKKIENQLGRQFSLSNHSSTYDLECLSILIASFINNKPCKIGNIENMEITLKSKEEVERIKGAKGNFTAILDCSSDEVYGVKLNGLYKVLFYGPIEIVNYKVVNEKENSIKCRLINKINKDTVASVMYFTSKENAQKIARDRIEDFKHTEYAWKVNNPN